MAESWKVKNRRWHANLGMMAAVTLGLIAISCPFIAHKWDGNVGKTLKRIHYGEFLPANLKWVWIDSQGLFLAFLVVSGWLMHKKAVKQASRSAADDPAAAGSSVTVLDLDGKGGAPAFVAKAQARGLRAFHCPADKATGLNLPQEKWLLVMGAGGELNEDVRRAFTQYLATLRPASLKRLEFSFEPSSDSEFRHELRTALLGAGARDMAASATVPAAWAAQMLVKLASRSGSVKPEPAKAPRTEGASVLATPKAAEGA